MNFSAREARRKYMQKYRQNNRERLNAKQREWCKSNPEKVKKIVDNYWSKRAYEESLKSIEKADE